MPLNLGYALGSAIFIVLFRVAVAALRYHPLIYWAVIIATTMLGTTMADFADRRRLSWRCQHSCRFADRKHRDLVLRRRDCLRAVNHLAAGRALLLDPNPVLADARHRAG